MQRQTFFQGYNMLTTSEENHASYQMGFLMRLRLRGRGR
ncbi:MAG: hypothetical protein PWQ55_713 [Chloroflexota bacterium]|nr:hypothetical protein [Chloroflexota bacterium]